MRYATPDNWARHFREKEGIQISESPIRSQMRKADKIGLIARGKAGNILDSLYSESDVREVCADYLSTDFPQADEYGFFELNGEKHGTFIAWSRFLSISAGMIRKNLRENNKPIVKGKIHGKIFDFYSESDVYEVCANLLQSFDRADKFGFIEKDGVRYGTTKSLSRLLGISQSAIERKIKSSCITPVRGRVASGNLANFYLESDIHSVCTDLRGTFSKAGKLGFVEKDGVCYGTIRALAKTLEIAAGTIRSKVKLYSVQLIKEKNGSGRISNFYPEQKIRFLCSYLLNPLPQADKLGFIEKDGVRYGSIATLARFFNIDTSSIVSRLESSSIQSIKGKTKGGQVRDFYSEPEICLLCNDLLQKLPQVDESGFIEKDSVRFGTMEALSRAIDISTGTIKKRIKAASLKPIKGKMKGGQVRDFYSESDIRSACADLIKKRSNPHAA